MQVDQAQNMVVLVVNDRVNVNDSLMMIVMIVIVNVDYDVDVMICETIET